MSVERIAPLGQTATDLSVTTRPVAAPAFDPGPAPPVLFPPLAPTEGLSHAYDSLALPLADMTPGAGPTTAQVSALYRAATTSGATILMTDGRLPVTALRHAVETLLADLAEARDVPVAEMIAQAEKTGPERLPSRNGEKAQFTFRGRLAATDADGKLRPLDLYLTRIGERQWEAAAYERSPARAATLFPRPGAIVDQHRLIIDPDLGLVRACVPWGTPRTTALDGRPEQTSARIYARLAAATGGAVALLTLLTQGPSWGPSALLVAALVMALAAG